MGVALENLNKTNFIHPSYPHWSYSGEQIYNKNSNYITCISTNNYFSPLLDFKLSIRKNGQRKDTKSLSTFFLLIFFLCLTPKVHKSSSNKEHQTSFKQLSDTKLLGEKGESNIKLC